MTGEQEEMCVSLVYRNSEQHKAIELHMISWGVQVVDRSEVNQV